MIQLYRIKKGGKYVHTVEYESQNEKDPKILYTEKKEQSLVISALEIIKYQKLLDNVLGHGSYMLESITDLN
ncbi:hypothetical protein NST02_08390 [Robertmurraya sp. FSL W8-0741]|uniref:hypothetical protein n=1 Tax=Robertmurraya sp. FSL W8-0741 TaxID=2954629 RepID=UPI000BA751C9|nr:hypothetical protein CHH80_05055 [Bacillus sp. 7504-2]